MSETVQSIFPKANLYRKLGEIQASLDKIYRDKKIETQKGAYTVTTEAAVLDLVRPKLVEYGLLYFPVDIQCTVTGNVATVVGKYKIIDIDTGEYEIIGSTGAGHDVSDKHAGKAMTYCGKYGLVKLFNLTGTDDPDASGSEQNLKAEKVAYENKKAQMVAQIGSKAQLIDFINENIMSGKIPRPTGERLLQRAMGLAQDDIAGVKEGAAYIATLV